MVVVLVVVLWPAVAEVVVELLVVEAEVSMVGSYHQQGEAVSSPYMLLVLVLVLPMVISTTGAMQPIADFPTCSL